MIVAKMQQAGTIQIDYLQPSHGGENIIKSIEYGPDGFHIHFSHKEGYGGDRTDVGCLSRGSLGDLNFTEAVDQESGKQIVSAVDGQPWDGFIYDRGREYQGSTAFTYNLIGPNRSFMYRFGCMATEDNIPLFVTSTDSFTIGHHP